METFERKLTTMGDAVGLTIPKYLCVNKGYEKGTKVKVSIQIIDEKNLNVVWASSTPDHLSFTDNSQVFSVFS